MKLLTYEGSYLLISITNKLVDDCPYTVNLYCLVC